MSEQGAPERIWIHEPELQLVNQEACNCKHDTQYTRSDICAALVEALENYGEHSPSCASSLRYPSPPCDCGLDAAIAQAREEK